MLRPLREINVPHPVVTEHRLKDYELKAHEIERFNQSLEPLGYRIRPFTSHIVTDNARDDRPPNYAVIPNQYFVYACELYELASELVKYFQYFDDLRSNGRLLLGTADEIQAALEGAGLEDRFQSPQDLELFAKFLDREDRTWRLGAKNLVDKQGRPRGSKDCFGSVILQVVNMPAMSSSVFGYLVYDLVKSPDLYKELRQTYVRKIESSESRSVQPKEALRKPWAMLETTPLPKPFILLAGISGTGKSRFVRRQAEVVPANDNFCMVPVRPDWHEPSDLLGYTTRLSGAVEYVATDVLRFVVRAWKVLKDKGFSLSGDAGVTILEGDENALRHVAPMWLCLDEMNLAPVEQYFADYLSILETRRWDWTNDSFTYRSDALLGPTQLQELRANADGTERLTRYLGLDVEGDDAALWALFLDVGIAIPPQLIVAGTVNMDETTHGFSRKVLDRALTFDFGEFFPNVFEDFFEQSIEAKVFGFPLHSHVTLNALSTCEADPNGNKSISFLKALNRVLKGSPFELAYRALNELLLTVVSYQPINDIELQAVWDDFLMLKVLPRMEGDADKLQYKQQDRSLLSDVRTVLRQQLSGIWNEDAKRLDYHRTMHGNALDISCRSRVKLQWMEERLRTVGFTSFWP